MRGFKLLAAALAVGLLLAAAGCEDNEGPAEKAGKEIDQALEKAGKEIDKTLDKAGDKAKEATD